MKHKASNAKKGNQSSASHCYVDKSPQYYRFVIPASVEMAALPFSCLESSAEKKLALKSALPYDAVGGSGAPLSCFSVLKAVQWLSSATKRMVYFLASICGSDPCCMLNLYAVVLSEGGK